MKKTLAACLLLVLASAMCANAASTELSGKVWIKYCEPEMGFRTGYAAELEDELEKTQAFKDGKLYLRASATRPNLFLGTGPKEVKGEPTMVIELWYPGCGEMPSMCTDYNNFVIVPITDSPDGEKQYIFLSAFSDKVPALNYAEDGQLVKAERDVRRSYFKGAAFYAGCENGNALMAGNSKEALEGFIQYRDDLPAANIPQWPVNMRYYLVDDWATSMVIGFEEDKDAVNNLTKAKLTDGGKKPLVVLDGDGYGELAAFVLNPGERERVGALVRDMIGKTYVVASGNVFFDRRDKKEFDSLAYQTYYWLTAIDWMNAVQGREDVPRIVRANLYGCKSEDTFKEEGKYKVADIMVVSEGNKVYVGNDGVVCNFRSGKVETLVNGEDVGKGYGSLWYCEAKSPGGTGDYKPYGNVGENGVYREKKSPADGEIMFMSGIYKCATLRLATKGDEAFTDVREPQELQTCTTETYMCPTKYKKNDYLADGVTGRRCSCVAFIEEEEYKDEFINIPEYKKGEKPPVEIPPEEAPPEPGMSKILGKVINPDIADPLKNGIVGAEVSVKDESTSEVVATLTTEADGEGHFRVIIPPGTYTLTATKDGKQGEVTEVVGKDGEITPGIEIPIEGIGEPIEMVELLEVRYQILAPKGGSLEYFELASEGARIVIPKSIEELNFGLKFKIDPGGYDVETTLSIGEFTDTRGVSMYAEFSLPPNAFMYIDRYADNIEQLKEHAPGNAIYEIKVTNKETREETSWSYSFGLVLEEEVESELTKDEAQKEQDRDDELINIVFEGDEFQLKAIPDKVRPGESTVVSASDEVEGVILTLGEAGYGAASGWFVDGEVKSTEFVDGGRRLKVWAKDSPSAPPNFGVFARSKKGESASLVVEILMDTPLPKITDGYTIDGLVNVVKSPDSEVVRVPMKKWDETYIPEVVNKFGFDVFLKKNGSPPQHPLDVLKSTLTDKDERKIYESDRDDWSIVRSTDATISVVRFGDMSVFTGEDYVNELLDKSFPFRHYFDNPTTLGPQYSLTPPDEWPTVGETGEVYYNDLLSIVDTLTPGTYTYTVSTGMDEMTIRITVRDKPRILPGTVTGKVVGTENLPVPGATVSAEGETAKTTTNKYGGFALSLLPGMYTLAATIPGKQGEVIEGKTGPKEVQSGQINANNEIVIPGDQETTATCTGPDGSCKDNVPNTAEEQCIKGTEGKKDGDIVIIMLPGIYEPDSTCPKPEFTLTADLVIEPDGWVTITASEGVDGNIIGANSQVSGWTLDGDFALGWQVEDRQIRIKAQDKPGGSITVTARPIDDPETRTATVAVRITGAPEAETPSGDLSEEINVEPYLWIDLPGLEIGRYFTLVYGQELSLLEYTPKEGFKIESMALSVALSDKGTSIKSDTSKYDVDGTLSMGGRTLSFRYKVQNQVYIDYGLDYSWVEDLTSQLYQWGELSGGLEVRVTDKQTGKTGKWNYGIKLVAKVAAEPTPTPSGGVLSINWGDVLNNYYIWVRPTEQLDPSVTDVKFQTKAEGNDLYHVSVRAYLATSGNALDTYAYVPSGWIGPDKKLIALTKGEPRKVWIPQTKTCVSITYTSMLMNAYLETGKRYSSYEMGFNTGAKTIEACEAWAT
jgi:hypothetical protein